MINRDFYLNQIIKSKWDGQIKVITGIRRVGKSVLLFELYKEHLINEGVSEENIITISLDQRKYFKYRNPITLCEYVEAVIGSNSRMLSNDIMTEFRGRSTQIHVYPLSFEEYYSFMGGDESKRLNEYLFYGGMPRITQLADEIDKKKYLDQLYKEVYIKGIVERNKIEKENVLEDILNYLSSQISSLTNPTKVANALSDARKEKIDSNLVSSYIN